MARVTATVSTADYLVSRKGRSWRGSLDLGCDERAPISGAEQWHIWDGTIRSSCTLACCEWRTVFVVDAVGPDERARAFRPEIDKSRLTPKGNLVIVGFAIFIVFRTISDSTQRQGLWTL